MPLSPAERELLERRLTDGDPWGVKWKHIHLEIINSYWQRSLMEAGIIPFSHPVPETYPDRWVP
jgi:hypothetical protein